MAITARIDTTGAIGRATVRSPTRTAIAAQSFTPKPNVSLGEVNDVSTIGVQNGYTLVFNSGTGKFETKEQPAANVSLNEITDVSTVGVQDGFTLVFNSNTNKFEAQPASNVAVDITKITGGFF